MLATDVPLDPLPPGITWGARPDGGLTDVAAFTAAAYYAARVAGGTVVHVNVERKQYASYVYAILDVGSRGIVALCNRAYPVVAFAERVGQVYMSHRYVDAPDLAEAFGHVSFLPVPLPFLTAPPSALSLEALPAAERKNIRYWIRYGRITRAGNVLFNDWD